MKAFKYDQSKAEEILIKFRRDLHQIPEIGFDLPKTVKYVCDVLEENGIPYKKIVNGSAVVALIEGEKSGKTLGLRADMDALPVKEETDLEFKSINGNMHACGHDCHTAILLTTGIILNNHRDELKGNVKLLFQPSEEKDGGAKPMIDEGCLKNPEVDYVLGQHVGVLSQEIEIGQMGFVGGPMMASLDEFTVDFVGQGGHGAYPHDTIDPVPMAASAILALQAFMARKVNALDSAVFTIGQVHGGTQYNIIPDSVSINGTVRCLSEEVRQQIADGCKKICTHTAESYDGKAEINYNFGYPALINDEELADKVFNGSKELFGEKNVKKLSKPSMGSEDFAYFAQEVPAVFTFLNTSKECDGVIYPNHNPKFLVDEDILIKGVDYFVQMSMNLL
ncbi:MAG: M20 family metallopeptidase [Peptoniphilus sp.]|nr:M20 family metallopeptidase [Peptoniphilus sp.]MDD7363052.1 M20 family metallopeptidase [Bacillota bacterium]MDY6045317.1 M20 family metallopeptidase [Peptoniphilus sp.]